MWISTQHTEAQMVYIQYGLYSSSINVMGNQTTDLKESKPNMPEVLLSLEGQIEMCTHSAKGRLNLSWTKLTQGQSMLMLSATNLLLSPLASGGKWGWLWQLQVEVAEL